MCFKNPSSLSFLYDNAVETVDLIVSPPPFFYQKLYPKHFVADFHCKLPLIAISLRNELLRSVQILNLN